MRFIHSSDLHLGRTPGRFDAETAGVLAEARATALDRLAALARETGATAILLAGDTFDQATPAPRVIRQACRAMARAADITWVVLPGNHDALAAEPLWDAVRAACPDNVRLALAPEPVMLDGAAVLPAPVTRSAPGRDLTAWMDTAEAVCGLDPALPRIGLAHGPTVSFGSSDSADVIAPDRAARAGLDYLALGDWHGVREVDARTWYCGTPEPDSFKHGVPGCALVVDIPGRGEKAAVTARDVGRFVWCAPDLALRPGDDPAADLARALPEEAVRDATLVRLRPAGRITLAERTALERAIAQAAPDFRHFAADLDALEVAHDTGDLDTIAARGALRDAADTLAARAEGDSAEARVARDALTLLHEIAMEVDE